MAAYAYKWVKDYIPPFITDSMEDYEGEANYDGDLWDAAHEYICALEQEVAFQHEITKTAHSPNLLNWLKNRPETFYCGGPVIKGNS